MCSPPCGSVAAKSSRFAGTACGSVPITSHPRSERLISHRLSRESGNPGGRGSASRPFPYVPRSELTTHSTPFSTDLPALSHTAIPSGAQAQPRNLKRLTSRFCIAIPSPLTPPLPFTSFRPRTGTQGRGAARTESLPTPELLSSQSFPQGLHSEGPVGPCPFDGSRHTTAKPVNAKSTLLKEEEAAGVALTADSIDLRGSTTGSTLHKRKELLWQGLRPNGATVLCGRSLSLQASSSTGIWISGTS